MIQISSVFMLSPQGSRSKENHHHRPVAISGADDSESELSCILFECACSMPGKLTQASRVLFVPSSDLSAASKAERTSASSKWYSWGVNRAKSHLARATDPLLGRLGLSIQIDYLSVAAL